MKYDRAGAGYRPRYRRGAGHAFVSAAPRHALNGRRSHATLVRVTAESPGSRLLARKIFSASTASDTRSTTGGENSGANAAEIQSGGAPIHRTQEPSFRFYRGGSGFSGAWAIVGALLLTLVVMSSLTVRPHSVTNEEIARAVHHMPHERGIPGRN